MVFSKKLVDWYKVNKRDLPWRDISNAYRIWISEIILQQTKVSQGLPYYLKFIDTFPNVADLANANLDNVDWKWGLNKDDQNFVYEFFDLFIMKRGYV